MGAEVVGHHGVDAMSIELEYSASALVTMTIEFTGNGHWGKEATVEEVSRQGGRETLNAIAMVLQELRLKGVVGKVVGNPEHGVVVTTREKK